jgi:lysozyme family protein
MSVNITQLKARNAQRWANMKLDKKRLKSFQSTAERLCAPEAKARYQNISKGTERLLLGVSISVPWSVIAVIHEREAGGPPHWDKQLGQGDPLSRASIHDPKGRGPFFNHPDDPPGQDAFYRGALDALTDCHPFAAKWQDWSIGGALTLLEEYNGLGYAMMGVPSAYVWSGTDQYKSGKYIRDRVYRKNVVDVQNGCAPILYCMMQIDPSIVFTALVPAVA